MSKKSVVLLAAVGLAATAGGAWLVRRRSMEFEAFETSTIDSAIPTAAGVPATNEWNGVDEDALASVLTAAVDDEPVNVR